MRRRLVTIVVALAACGVSAVAIAAEPGTTDYTPTAGGTYNSVRPTGVGLPQTGAAGSIGVAELAGEVRRYHDSGQYGRDLGAVGGAAVSYLNRRLADNLARAKRVRSCKTVYKRLRTKKVKRRVYVRKRSCKHTTVTPQRFTGKPAIVLDIDETSLSNYDGLNSSNCSQTGLVAPAVAGTGTAIGPVLSLYRLAKSRGVSVFFVTGRPSAVQGPTESNLRAAGYNQGWEGLQFKPGNLGTQAYKAGARQAIVARGYDIVANVGDQESDLDGGYADRAFKLPNPFYFISD